jgi:hypothetical protein
MRTKPIEPSTPFRVGWGADSITEELKTKTALKSDLTDVGGEINRQINVHKFRILKSQSELENALDISVAASLAFGLGIIGETIP